MIVRILNGEHKGKVVTLTYFDEDGATFKVLSGGEIYVHHLDTEVLEMEIVDND